MMFSYSKRLALLLTICGTLLNTSPLLAAKDGDTTKQSSQRSWLNPWTWGKKKGDKPKETKEDLLKQVNTRLDSINKLKKEFSQSQETLLRASMKEKDEEKREKLSNRYEQKRETIGRQLTDWKLKLDSDRNLLGNLQTIRPKKMEEIEQDVKAAGDFINKTYGRKRRVKSWFEKKVLRTKNTPQPTAQGPSPVHTPAQDVSTKKESEDVFEDAPENL